MKARSRYEGVRIVLSGVLTATMVLVALPQSSAQSRQPGPSPAAVAHRQFFDRYCVSCHNERLKSGDFNLASADPDAARRDAAVLGKSGRASCVPA